MLTHWICTPCSVPLCPTVDLPHKVGLLQSQTRRYHLWHQLQKAASVLFDRELRKTLPTWAVHTLYLAACAPHAVGRVHHTHRSACLEAVAGTWCLWEGLCSGVIHCVIVLLSCSVPGTPRFQPLMFNGVLGRCRSSKRTEEKLVFLTFSFSSGFPQDVVCKPKLIAYSAFRY